MVDVEKALMAIEEKEKWEKREEEVLEEIDKIKKKKKELKKKKKKLKNNITKYEDTIRSLRQGTSNNQSYNFQIESTDEIKRM